MNRNTYNKETSYSHDDLLWMSYHNSQDVLSVCLLFFYNMIPVYVRYSYMYSEIISQRARETSLMLYNLRVQRSNGILLLTNYNQNAHNFFLIILVNGKGSTIPKPRRNIPFFQLDVHICNCNSKRIIRSTSYWSQTHKPFHTHWHQDK